MTDPTSIDRNAPVVAHHDISIQAPLASVWALHVDVNSWAAWNSDMTSAHLDGAFTAGAVFDWESYGFPVSSTVYAVELHRRILWGGTAGGITGVHEWLFTPVAGGTHVETNESFAGSAVEADAAGMQSMLDASLVAWLRHLKTASETQTASSHGVTS